MRAGNLALRMLNPGLPSSGELFLRVFSMLPPSAREKLLFGSSRACFPMQKLVQRLLAGPVMVRGQFAEGLLRGHLFECLTSEKYFFLGGAYEHRVQRLLTGILRPGDTVYDVGAHAGYWALWLAAFCGPAGRIVAFEPSPRNFERLKRNIESNRMTNISALNVAVSDAEGTALLSENGSESCIVPAGAARAAGCVEIRTIRLDDFVGRDQGPPPSFVKIDVEGAAARCLAGLSNVLRQVRPRLLCEIHHVWEGQEVSEILARQAYRFEYLEPGARFPRHLIASPGQEL